MSETISSSSMISFTIRCALAISATKERSWAAFMEASWWWSFGSGGTHFSSGLVGQGARAPGAAIDAADLDVGGGQQRVAAPGLLDEVDRGAAQLLNAQR